MRHRPCVVFACGQLLTAECWAPQMAALGPDFELHIADHSHDDSIAGIAERLLETAPASFDLVAHAMGGFVAFEVMRRQPQRVRSLVLASTLASADGPAQTERRQGYIRLVEAGNFDGVVEERIPILLHPARREDVALLDVVRRMAAETGPAVFLRQQRAIMGRIDSRPSLTTIACPTLLVRGEDDAIATLAQQQEMLDLLPNARLESLPHAGHLVTLERPRTMAALLRNWLAGTANV
jgi:pimeloyl-ACP methyl ester carboxylesterase